MDKRNPILNNPYEEPKKHYATDPEGNLNYADIRKGRRIFTPDIQAIPVRQGPQGNLFEVNDLADQYGGHLINLVRAEVGKWRDSGYVSPVPTRVTKELLDFWFNNPERQYDKRLFFAQREAIETAAWLNEIAAKSNAGQNIINRLKQAQAVNGNDEMNLPRIAFKMATGTGKTVVMAALILYHYFNRQEYRNDTRFADYFLVMVPGITIKDRLGVLRVNIGNHRDSLPDYYHLLRLVPPKLEKTLEGLNARIRITNFHTFEPRTLQGNKRSPFDGKIDAGGKKAEAKEDFSQVTRRVLGKFKTGARLLVFNDEGHHCYLPKEKGKTNDDENSKEENERAAVWHTGLTEVAKKFKVASVYDLSATPYYLSGTGYLPYSLFPWVVSDFGLIEAIESGLVKIPFLPESDDTQELTMPVLRNLYEHVKGDLPKKGRERQKKEAKEEGKKLKEQPPKLPPLVKSALNQFYDHYEKEYSRIRGLFDNPPVFIVVCNNTSVSKEVYKHIAGYELSDGEAMDIIPGVYDLFSNFDGTTKKPLRKPPTLLIDSDALENSNQINDDFKKIFSPEIEAFKREYRTTHPEKSVEQITDADILREVVNTVGKKGYLGSHIRCVVSVSMLTEGWDANTVTHIMGLRAFGSQLLCEQVAGRALRRQNYGLDRRTNKFAPEYAHIIGVPFKMFKGGKTEITLPPDYTRIFAMPERQEKYEITFPNLAGYRVEPVEGDISADFSKVEDFEFDGTKFPMKTILASPFSSEEKELTVESVKEKRDQELVYIFTKELIRRHYSDQAGNPEFQKFNKLKRIVEHWYFNKLKLIGITDPEYRKLLYFEDAGRVCEHIMMGIRAESGKHDKILPIFNYYNKFGSTRYVNGNTSKSKAKLFATKKSHVNYVAGDTDSWEQIAAKSLEDLPQVESYVKNSFLNFAIPYVAEGKDRLYYPDFIASCQRSDHARINLIIEITGMNKDKAMKKDYVHSRWLPAVNAVRDQYGYNEWRFIEIAGDIRDIKNELLAVIEGTGA
jgi:type III restriction enzyme